MSVQSSTAPAVESSPEGARPAPARRRRLLDFAEAYGLILLTIAVIAFFALLPASSDTFFTMANLRIVLVDQAVLMVVALAVLVPMVAGVWNFTPGAAAGMASIYAAQVGASSGSFALAALAGIAAGAVVGAVVAVLITTTKINSVIATFAMTIIIAGVVDLETGGNSIVSGLPRTFNTLGTGEVLGIPTLFWLAAIVAAVVHYLMRMTPFGRSLYATGANRQAAKLVGLRVERLTALALIVSGVLAGIAGVILLARSGAGNPTVGPGFTIPAFAAVFLGAVAVRPGQWNVGGLIAAIAFLGALNSGLTLAGAAASVSALASGLALLVGVGFANVFARQRGRQLETS
ncbi:ABC transporter permease [Conexibacter stalactiti]|uniref:ABC transporter permease n=1 Tax=Conexibacter stalactiti TaxID=1940611 RepID=A0ABU4HWC1_9ACTN|nr:ABC transporter permease [Conexibacter stalactiti]MDW5597633.1 ABC transporter permease [Conexibacter stalactiti]MEC5038275.1 ABC transporter permease [Conexibacter stalactiti]